MRYLLTGTLTDKSRKIIIKTLFTSYNYIVENSLKKITEVKF